MNKLIKILTSKFSAGLKYLILVLLPGVLYAGHADPASGGLHNPLKSEYSSIPEFIGAIVKIARDIGFFVAIFFIVYSGFLFVKARGNETEITKAKSVFTWTLVGTAVLLGAWLFAEAIQGTIDNLRV